MLGKLFGLDSVAWTAIGTLSLSIVTIAYVIVTGRIATRTGESAAAAERGAQAAERSAQASERAAAINQATLEEIRRQRAEERDRRLISDLRNMHSLLIEMTGADFGNRLSILYGMKRELLHVYEVSGIHLPTVASIANAPDDPDQFRHLLPQATMEVRDWIRTVEAPDPPDVE